MRTCSALLCIVAMSVMTGAGSLPEGVMEHLGIIGMGGSVLELKDGLLVTNARHVSTDGGKTWSAPLGEGEGGGGAEMRLASGALVKVSPVGYGSGRMSISRDEGRTWTDAGRISVPGGPVFELGDTMIQLARGRLLYCWDFDMSGNHPEMTYGAMTATGIWKGKTYAVEGHGHIPEFFASGFSWSDDEGKTWEYPKWQNMPNVLMGWFDTKGEPNGMAGINPVGESSIAELSDGRVLLFGRSVVGRLVSSDSADGGESWSALLPTELASSGSPPRLRRIPGTNDLLCVWNQVSAEEIRRGYRRGRLSSAISKDSGATWESFKTIEVCDGLECLDRVQPDPDVQMIRGRKNVGTLPDGYAFYHYPNVCFAEGKVYILYSRGYPEMGVAETLLHKQDKVLRIYPVEWFYD